MSERELYRGAAVARAARQVTGILHYMSTLLPLVRAPQGNSWQDAETVVRGGAARALQKGRQSAWQHWPRHALLSLE